MIHAIALTGLRADDLVGRDFVVAWRNVRQSDVLLEVLRAFSRARWKSDACRVTLRFSGVKSRYVFCARVS